MAHHCSKHWDSSGDWVSLPDHASFLLQEFCSPLTQGLYLLDPLLVSLFHCTVYLCVVAPRKYHNLYPVMSQTYLMCVSFICCIYIPLVRLVHPVSCLLWPVNQAATTESKPAYMAASVFGWPLGRRPWLRGSLGPFSPHCYKLEAISTFLPVPRSSGNPLHCRLLEWA